MIVVIADDLTGAAELGGIGLRYGLSVEIVTDINLSAETDLLVIATDTRSMPQHKAVEEMAAITAMLRDVKPDLIYKKVDSALRGHIIAELKAQIIQLGVKRALLVPANPALGRTIINGNYFLHGKPIHLSSFSSDPEFGITGSDVRGMLRVNGSEVYVQAGDEQLPGTGITVGECAHNDDFKLWVDKADKDTLLAGGSGFFTALMEGLNYGHLPTGKKNNGFESPSLFVCGSTFDKSRQLVENVNKTKGLVSYMPQSIVALTDPPDSLFEAWADEVTSLLKRANKAVIAVDENTTKDAELTKGSLRDKKAIVVEKIFKKLAVKELLVEGGSTAASIIKRLNMNKFFPVNEFNTGVIRMRVAGANDLFLTLKPGSYDWPPMIWDFE